MTRVIAAMVVAVIVTMGAPAHGGAYPGNFNPSSTLDPSQVINPKGK